MKYKFADFGLVINDQQILKHWLIVGSAETTKKPELMRGLLRQHIRSGRPLILMDARGDLFAYALGEFQAKGITPLLIRDRGEFQRTEVSERIFREDQSLLIKVAWDQGDASQVVGALTRILMMSMSAVANFPYVVMINEVTFLLHVINPALLGAATRNRIGYVISTTGGGLSWLKSLNPFFYKEMLGAVGKISMFPMQSRQDQEIAENLGKLAKTERLE